MRHYFILPIILFSIIMLQGCERQKLESANDDLSEYINYWKNKNGIVAYGRMIKRIDANVNGAIITSYEFTSNNEVFWLNEYNVFLSDLVVPNRDLIFFITCDENRKTPFVIVDCADVHLKRSSITKYNGQ